MPSGKTPSLISPTPPLSRFSNPSQFSVFLPTLIFLEHFRGRLAVCSANTIPQRGKLTVIEVKLGMVNTMTCCAIDDGTVGVVLSVVDEDGPDVDEGKEGNVREFLQREQEWKEVVWNRLREAIERMERMRGVRGGHDPLVMRLVQRFVDEWVMQPAVDPVDEAVRKQDEEGELEKIVPWEGGFGGEVVQFGVPADFGQHAHGSQKGHARHGFVGLKDFQANLIFQEFRMLEGGFIEDENVGERSAAEVEEESEKPGWLCELLTSDWV